MNILIIGGDKRMNIALNELKKVGYKVDTLGLIEGDNGSITSADVILLPVPTTRDGENIFCPQSDRVIPLKSLDNLPQKPLILSCGCFCGGSCIDYLRLDGFCLLNAVPTAEGAIARAIIDTPFCLWQSRVLVIGYGRVAKILVDRLSALKCDITVSARKPRDFAMLDTLDIKHFYTKDVVQKAKEFDIIFNTIDANLFDNLDCLKNTFLYDLSTKGCLDFDAAKSMGINAQKLPGLPGKIAPQSAGEIIAQTANNLIGEHLCKI
ncbi:MAG: dipicolinate synthase subunit DpsA [Clostridia bacterium]|nr:dipicolinate synthase subunit DpsA [Clostridia bacterium]